MLLVGYSLVIAVLVIWPIWSSFFLLKNQARLTDEVFSTKFSTLYQGIKLNSFRALLYNSVFSVRRFEIILMNVFFTANSPLSGIDRTFYLQKILCFLLIQFAYIIYVHSVHPHNDSIFNLLEFINEYAMVTLGYIMLNFAGIVSIQDPSDPNKVLPQNKQLNQYLEFASIGIIFFMALVNFGTMIKLSV